MVNKITNPPSQKDLIDKVNEVIDELVEENQLNNPFSLLDYKFSEYELNNASWLRSNGQFNSGSVYADVYNLLLAIYNGSTSKAGVSVKLSTETYADTDFVLNTSEVTFRLPTSVALASGKAIAGNGKTVGLTNGGQNGGLIGDPQGVLRYYSAAYGADVSTSAGPSIGVLVGYVGVTTDASKSGMETSTSGLYLYFYVGETVQNANVIAAGQALSDIAALKSYAMGIPDYSATLSNVGNNYTAPSNGYYIYSLENTNTTVSIAINNITFQYVQNAYGSAGGLFIPLAKGDIIKVNSGARLIRSYFIPCREF